MALYPVFLVEHRVDGAWKSADRWATMSRTDMLGAPIKEPAEPFFEGQNWALFAILSGMENSYAYRTISDASRGVPENLSDEVESYLGLYRDEGWGVVSPSWVTLAEIMGFDWEVSEELHAIVDAEQFDTMFLSRRGGPFEWGTPTRAWAAEQNPDDTLISATEMREKIAAIHARSKPQTLAQNLRAELKDVRCHVTWTQSYGDMVGRFLTRTVPALRQLGAPDGVRCVFWHS